MKKKLPALSEGVNYSLYSGNYNKLVRTQYNYNNEKENSSPLN